MDLCPTKDQKLAARLVSSVERFEYEPARDLADFAILRHPTDLAVCIQWQANVDRWR